MTRRAKIVATIGPASAKPQVLRALLKAGMDVARLNFSHGNHSDHAEVIRELRRLAKLDRCSVAILADLPGPKIRTGRLENSKPVQLRAGQRLTLTGQDILGNQEQVSISYRGFARDVHPRSRILLDDGSIELRVLEKRRSHVVCRVVNRGTLDEKKGVNLPDTTLNIPSVTPEDKKHLRFALQHGVDYIGQSFVRKADDVRELKRLIQRAGYETPVIAKIEKPEALEELDKIMELADGVMVARGDLGVEMDLEEVPSAQRHIIAGANQHRIPVITATQMLQSMVKNPRPTRAEVADVSAAIAQGTGAVMLSGETSVGKYPREAVLMMARIIRATEASVPPSRYHQPARDLPETVADTVADCVAVAAEQYHMAAIAVFTETGLTARLVSKARPTVPIVAFSPRPEVYSRLALLWGVLPRRIGRMQDVNHLIQEGERLMRREKLAKKGDLIAFVRSTMLHKEGKTNLLEFHTIGS